MSELSCDTLFIGRNETHDLSRYPPCKLVNACYESSSLCSYAYISYRRTRSAAQVAAAGGAGRPGGRGSRTRGGGATSGISGGRGAGRRGRRLCANAGVPS